MERLSTYPICPESWWPAQKTFDNHVNLNEGQSIAILIRERKYDGSL
jgi:hypothetical protein